MSSEPVDESTSSAAAGWGEALPAAGAWWARRASTGLRWPRMVDGSPSAQMRRSAPLSGRFVGQQQDDQPQRPCILQPHPSAPIFRARKKSKEGRNVFYDTTAVPTGPERPPTPQGPQGSHRAPLGPCHARSSSCPTLATIVHSVAMATERPMFGGARFVPGTRFVARDRAGRAVPAILKGRVSYNPNAHGFQPLGQINRKRPTQTRLFSAYTSTRKYFTAS